MNVVVVRDPSPIKEITITLTVEEAKKLNEALAGAPYVSIIGSLRDKLYTGLYGR